jgi:hypothetical protein
VRPARIALFSDRADDDDLARTSMVARRDEGGRERPFRVAGSASVQAAIFETNGQRSVDRVDVPEKENGRRASPDLRDGVSGEVRMSVQAEVASQRKEPMDSGSFLSRRAVSFKKGSEDFDIIHGRASSRGHPARTTIDPPG